MKKTFIDANEKYLAAVELYADEDGILYEDSDKTVGVVRDSLINWFMKGLIRIHYQTSIHLVHSLVKETEYASAQILVTSESGVAQSSFYSSEYEG